MTYMAGFEAEYAIDCQYFDGTGGDLNFIKNENVYFLGKTQTTNKSAEYLGYAGYFKINESPVAIISRFDSASNTVYLVSNGGHMANFRSRGICDGDIVVGARSKAVRKIGTNFKYYNDGTGSKLKTGIKEVGYDPFFHDLFDFSLDNRRVSYNRSKPFNYDFFGNSIFNNIDNKFSCLTVNDRFELPIPYTTNMFGFNMATAITPRHVFMCSHTAPYSSTTCQFYDPVSKNIITKTIKKTVALNDSVFENFIKNEDNNNIAIQPGDVAICLLDSPLPDSIRPAYIPDVAYRDFNSTFVRRMDVLMIDQTMRGYYMNAARGGRIFQATGSYGSERFDFGTINSSQFMENVIDMYSAPLFAGVGDSNSMLFTSINNNLIHLGSISSGSGSSICLDGTFIGEESYSELDLYFPWYPDRDGKIVNTAKNRYRDEHFWGSNASFWMTIGNKALRHLFTSSSVWNEPIDPSFVPSRIKITNDINIVEPATIVKVAESTLIGNKIKFVS